MNTVEKACNYPRIYHAMETKKICLAHSLDGCTKAVSSFSKVGFHHSKSPITVRNLVLLFLQHLRITIGMKTLLNHQKAYSNFSLIDRIRTNHKTECRNKKRTDLRLVIAIRLKDRIRSKVIGSPSRNYFALIYRPK